MKQRLRLHYAPDNASLIVRLALLELGLPFDTVLIDRATNEQSSAAYRALNPHGLIPTLETPQGPIFETGAILLWLADLHCALAPAPDSPARGAFLKWLFFTSNTLHATLRMLFYPDKYVGADTAAQAALHHQLTQNLTIHLANLETLAAQQPDWFAAIHPTILDLYIGPLLRWMALYPKSGNAWFRLSDTPQLHALATRLETRDSVLAAAAAEGLGPTPFSAPQYANPPYGSAT